jgi:endoglucanase
MRKMSFLTILTLCLIGFTAAQERPFPQNIKYPYGFIPKTLNSDWLQSEYKRWKDGPNSPVKSCGSNSVMIQTDNGGKVEAIGFAMLIFAYMGDKTQFDGLYNFYKTNCNSSAGGMMGWIGQCGGNSNCSASDGDVDVAFSLIIASWQWPDGDYLDKAKQIITLMKKVVATCGNLKALNMGISGGQPYNGCNEIDISYYNPAAFRLFAKVIGNAQDSAMWAQLADDTYTILNAGANATTGLVADRQSVSGSPNGNYKYDACRTPWRICLDYLWNGNEKAKAWCIKVSNFADKFGIKNIQEGFSLSGSSLGGAHNMCYTGGFAIAAMANSQEMIDKFGTELKTLKDTYWFTFTLTPCYLLTLTGNQWRDDLKEKQDTGTTVLKNTVPASSNVSPAWNATSNHGLSVTGLKPGYSIAITDISGKQLYRATSSSEKALIDIATMKTGCTILTITDRNKKILKRGIFTML